MWVAVDPAGQFANSYSYTGGNPIILVDPDGESATAAGAVTGFGIGLFTGFTEATGKGIKGWDFVKYVGTKTLFSTAKGAITGSIIDAGGSTLLLGIAANSTLSALESGLLQKIENPNQQIDQQKVAKDAVISGGLTLVGGGLGLLEKTGVVSSAVTNSETVIEAGYNFFTGGATDGGAALGEPVDPNRFKKGK